jgi:hypothetical protein
MLAAPIAGGLRPANILGAPPAILQRFRRGTIYRARRRCLARRSPSIAPRTGRVRGSTILRDSLRRGRRQEIDADRQVPRHRLALRFGGNKFPQTERPFRLALQRARPGQNLRFAYVSVFINRDIHRHDSIHLHAHCPGRQSRLRLRQNSCRNDLGSARRPFPLASRPRSVTSGSSLVAVHRHPDFRGRSRHTRGFRSCHNHWLRRFR